MVAPETTTGPGPDALGDGQAELVAWIDGQCALCQRARHWIELRDRRGRVGFRDLHEAREAELPGPREQMLARLWVVPREGAGGPSVAAGLEALRQILLRLPGWRWAARLAGFPPLSWLGSLVYRIVARHRHRLGRALGCDAVARPACGGGTNSEAHGLQSSTGTGSPNPCSPSQDATKMS